jgi:hypothetical protein
VRIGSDGQVAYEEVYAFGHKDAKAVAPFFQLTLKPVGTNASQISVERRVLELTPSHFVPLLSAGTNHVLESHCQTIIPQPPRAKVFVSYDFPSSPFVT